MGFCSGVKKGYYFIIYGRFYLATAARLIDRIVAPHGMFGIKISYNNERTWKLVYEVVKHLGSEAEVMIQVEITYGYWVFQSSSDGMSLERSLERDFGCSKGCVYPHTETGARDGIWVCEVERGSVLWWGIGR